MLESISKPALADVPNGIKSPVYSDRQVVRASDLTLDRESHDKELHRMRRYLHGWGVVVGLEVHTNGKTTSVKKGYGITPLGTEVFLSGDLLLNNLNEQVWSCCGPDGLDCSLIDETRIRELAESLEGDTVTAWLIAKPSQRLSDPRAGVPNNCDHPANQLLPTRSCESVRLELICALPPSHSPTEPNCEVLSPYLCGAAAGEAPPYLAVPPAYSDDADFLVLAKLTSKRSDDNFLLAVDRTDRKTLLPNWVLQQFLSSCVCPPASTEPEPTPPVVDDNDDVIVVDPGVDIDFEPGWEVLDPVITDPRIVDPIIGIPGFGPGVIPDDGHTDPPRNFDKFPVIGDADIREKLVNAGINGPKNFLEADIDNLMAITGLSRIEIEKEIGAINEFTHLFNGPSF